MSNAETAIKELSISYPSADGSTEIKGMLWIPEGDIRGVVQLVHGMSEHIGRYEDFAHFLCRHGFAACGHSHIGHGESAASPDDFGHMPAKRGENSMVEDVESLRQIISRSFPEGTPYFVFGHSMGSLVTRVYISRYGRGLTGAVLCGTANEPVAVAKAGNILARLISATRGERTKSKLLQSLADGAYTKAIKNPRTQLDWLSYSDKVVDDYLMDEACGFMFTAGGYATLTQLAYDAARKGTVERIPKNLPLLFIAGADDPVGNNGRGVEKAAELARKVGIKDVDLIIYPHMRHEILNEDGHNKVYEDVLNWLSRHAV